MNVRLFSQQKINKLAFSQYKVDLFNISRNLAVDDGAETQ